MKIKSVFAGILMCAAVAAVSGCKKEQAASDVQPPKSNEGVASEAATAVDAAKSAAKEVTNQAAVQAKAAEQQAQGLIDRAKSLVSEQKYQDALNSLNQLANTKLTPEQQKLVDDLKAQIQSALTKMTGSNAASALGGVLGGKK
jgi:hypothetical protein